jgi:hypothetical protein
MNKIITLILLFTVSISFGQSLPFDFESTITTSNFTDFDGGVATVLANPESSGINTSATVAQIVRNGGQVWSGSKVVLAGNIDFTTNNTITMKVYTTAPVGTLVKMKVESGAGSEEKDASTTVSGDWETLTWDFTGTPTNFNEIVFMFDFGNTGDGSATSTFLFDDVVQISTGGTGGNGTQIDLPVTFESTTVDYTMTDFGDNASSLVVDPTNASNNVMEVTKLATAETWAGTTISTPTGLATDMPFTLTDSKMTVSVWSPDAGIPIRLKVENANDATQTCETEAMTTVAGAWETLTFDFANEAAGTAELSVGLQNGWIYSMASIFFNFGTDGATAGAKTYYFDNVGFGETSVNTINKLEVEGLNVFPNPTNNEWIVSSENTDITMVELFDLQGRRLLLLTPNNRSVMINATAFAEGIYVAKVSTDMGTRTLKLVKR